MTAKLMLADLEAALGEQGPAFAGPGDLLAVSDVPVRVSAVLGRTSLTVAQLMALGTGSVLELDRRVGEAVDIYVNDRLVARGEMVVVDARLGVTMTEIVQDLETGV